MYGTVVRRYTLSNILMQRWMTVEPVQKKYNNVNQNIVEHLWSDLQ